MFGFDYARKADRITLLRDLQHHFHDAILDVVERIIPFLARVDYDIPWRQLNFLHFLRQHADQLIAEVVSEELKFFQDGAIKVVIDRLPQIAVQVL